MLYFKVLMDFLYLIIMFVHAFSAVIFIIYLVFIQNSLLMSSECISFWNQYYPHKH